MTQDVPDLVVSTTLHQVRRPEHPPDGLPQRLGAVDDEQKSRWQIELFFKWIKQHLKVKRFVGRTKNAVLSQLWVATCMYLLLAYLKFVLRLSWSLHQMLRVLQLNLFDRRPLVELFTTPSPPGSPDPQMLLWR